MKIAVCEDERKIAEDLAEHISDFMKLTYFDFNIDIFLTGEDFRKSPEIYDLLFLDCRLPDANGLTIAKELRDRDIDTAIIFVTAFEEYVYDSFEVRPFRYLLKPIDENAIRKAMIGFVKAYEKERHISIPTARKNHIVNLHDIVYIESDGKYSIVRLKNNTSHKS
ncbi:MAG: LytR/AlgR family response regulator transcription factor, partial [Acutalibacteraceae bacterium]